MSQAEILQRIAESLKLLEQEQEQARNARLVNDRGHVYYEGAFVSPPRPAGAVMQDTEDPRLMATA